MGEGGGENARERVREMLSKNLRENTMWFDRYGFFHRVLLRHIWWKNIYVIMQLLCNTEPRRKGN